MSRRTLSLPLLQEFQTQETTWTDVEVEVEKPIIIRPRPPPPPPKQTPIIRPLPPPNWSPAQPPRAQPHPRFAIKIEDREDRSYFYEGMTRQTRFRQVLFAYRRWKIIKHKNTPNARPSDHFPIQYMCLTFRGQVIRNYETIESVSLRSLICPSWRLRTPVKVSKTEFVPLFFSARKTTKWPSPHNPTRRYHPMHRSHPKGHSR